MNQYRDIRYDTIYRAIASVSVDYDDDEAPRDAYGRRAKVAFEGWMTEIQFAAHLGVVIPATTKCACGECGHQVRRRRFDGG